MGTFWGQAPSLLNRDVHSPPSVTRPRMKKDPKAASIPNSGRERENDRQTNRQRRGSTHYTKAVAGGHLPRTVTFVPGPSELRVSAEGGVEINKPAAVTEQLPYA